jgi:hypothetical protein
MRIIHTEPLFVGEQFILHIPAVNFGREQQAKVRAALFTVLHYHPLGDACFTIGARFDRELNVVQSDCEQNALTARGFILFSVAQPDDSRGELQPRRNLGLTIR